MTQFVSEAIRPACGAVELAAMARGEPGLPAAFQWRGKQCTIAAKLEQWKQSSPEGGRPGAERYLRRHYYRLKMEDGTIWTVYFVRQPPRGRALQPRWFLYTIADA